MIHKVHSFSYVKCWSRSNLNLFLASYSHCFSNRVARSALYLRYCTCSRLGISRSMLGEGHVTRCRCWGGHI